jgi:hypothetical protein
LHICTEITCDGCSLLLLLFLTQHCVNVIKGKLKCVNPFFVVFADEISLFFVLRIGLLLIDNNILLLLILFI